MLVSAVQSGELDLPAYCEILRERVTRDKVGRFLLGFLVGLLVASSAPESDEVASTNSILKIIGLEVVAKPYMPEPREVLRMPREG